MIIVKFHGRLGNQMFQYAFALNTAHQLKTFFLMDRLRKSKLVDYFQIGYTFSSEELNDKLVGFCRKVVRKKIYQDNLDHADEIKKKIKNNRYYQGYFHSKDYFESVSDLVKKRFQVRKKYRDIFENKFGDFFTQNKVIAIHCRLGDYLEWGDEQLGGKNLTLPKSYYQNALLEIKNINNYKIVIVTDDLQNIKDKFDFLPEKLIVSEEEIVDFQILQNANKVIVSNSSFSWWAAYLNNRNAIIYAPQFWLGFKIGDEFPKSVLPASWVKVRCENSKL